MAFRVIPRAEWKAVAPLSVSRMSVPAPKVFIHHSVTDPTSDGAADTRVLQRVAFWRGFVDISYSFVIHPSGQIYEGRGWGVVGGHTSGYNSVSHAIVFIGNFQSSTPTPAALEAARWLIAEGKRLGKIMQNATIDGHRAVSPTACPGDKLFAQINYIRKPTTAPPSSGPIYGPITEDTVQPVIIKGITLDNEGRGYYDLPGLNKDRVVSVLLNGADPTGGGYKPIVEFAALNFGGSTRVVFEGGIPGGAIDFTVWTTSS